MTSLTGMWWASFGSLAMQEYEAMKSPMGGSALGFQRPEPAVGVSRRDLQQKLCRWLVNQHRAQWQGPGNTQRQARENKGMRVGYT